LTIDPNFIENVSLHQEVRGIFVFKAGVEMQNNPTTIYNTLPSISGIQGYTVAVLDRT
jgi:hypothetical protein